MLVKIKFYDRTVLTFAEYISFGRNDAYITRGECAYEVQLKNGEEAQQAHFDSIAAGERIFDLTPYQATETKPK